MKKNLFLVSVLVVIPFSSSVAEGASSTLASTLEVYVFPAEGQLAEQQSKDEMSCYDWAVDNSGSDPFQLQKQSQQQQQQTDQQVQQAQQATQGAGVKGALGGAAAGAVIAEIADKDVSEGAAYGAAAGAISSRRRGRRASAQAQEQALQQGAAQQQASQDQIGNFKKAFSICLESKDYMVRY